jgi:Flp pilus assembly protein CpaB
MAQRDRTAVRETTSGNGADPRPDRSSDGPVRTVRRRRGLPGSRAVVGGLLVAVAAVGMFAASSRSGAGPHHSYVVATRALPAGARLQAADLELVTMELGPTLRAHAFEARQVLLGATLVAPLGAGELVQASAVVARKGEAASRELSFTLDRGRVSPGLKEGERADLLATWGTGDDAFTSVVVRQALVVALERPRSSSGDTGPTTVTVSVDDPNDALALAHATQLARITLVRATGAPPLPAVPATFRAGKA